MPVTSTNDPWLAKSYSEIGKLHDLGSNEKSPDFALSSGPLFSEVAHVFQIKWAICTDGFDFSAEPWPLTDVPCIINSV